MKGYKPVNRIRGFFTNLVQNPRQRNITIGVIVLLVGSALLKPLMASPHVSLAAEPILEHGPAWFTNALLTTLLVDIVLILLALATRAGLKEGVPSGLANFMEMVIEALYNVVENMAGKNTGLLFSLGRHNLPLRDHQQLLWSCPRRGQHWYDTRCRGKRGRAQHCKSGGRCG